MAKDLFHQAVRQALIKNGWTITSDPLIIRIERVKLEIDLAAEKVFAAEKDEQKIAVEVKSFINPSAISDFHNALGQFLNYRLALEMTEPKRILKTGCSFTSKITKSIDIQRFLPRQKSSIYPFSVYPLFSRPY